LTTGPGGNNVYNINPVGKLFYIKTDAFNSQYKNLVELCEGRSYFVKEREAFAF
jgi:hypothetical protein